MVYVMMVHRCIVVKFRHGTCITCTNTKHGPLSDKSTPPTQFASHGPERYIEMADNCKDLWRSSLSLMPQEWSGPSSSSDKDHCVAVSILDRKRKIHVKFTIPVWSDHVAVVQITTLMWIEYQITQGYGITNLIKCSTNKQAYTKSSFSSIAKWFAV